MKKFCALLSVFMFISCSKELTFETQEFSKKSDLPCTDQCPQVDVSIPIAKNGIVADSINAKVFQTLSSIIYFGEKPTTSKNYEQLLSSFIASYDKLKRDAPDEIFPWEGKVKGKVSYESEQILNLEIDHYIFTGGAHGYSGKRSLLFHPKTGKTITLAEIINDTPAFKTFAEKQFRDKYAIPNGTPINSKGLMFEDEKFQLPQNIFFTEQGLLFYYNAYEIASYAEGAQELLLPYDSIEKFLKIK